jgi:hypothetical protein
MPLTTVTPAAANPRPSARDLQPVGRRPPRPDDGHGARALLEIGADEALQPAGAAGDEEHGGSVLEVAQAGGIRRVVATDGVQARLLDGLAQRVDVQALELVGDRGSAHTAEPGEQLLLGEREDLAQPALVMAGDLDRPGQPRDEPRPRQARRARPGRPRFRVRAHAATPTPGLISWR